MRLVQITALGNLDPFGQRQRCACTCMTCAWAHPCAAQGLLRILVQAKDLLRDLAGRLARRLPGVRAPSEHPCRMHIKARACYRRFHKTSWRITANTAFCSTSAATVLCFPKNTHIRVVVTAHSASMHAPIFLRSKSNGRSHRNMQSANARG